MPQSHLKWLEREVFISGKRYPEEFKIEAVKQVVECGHSVSSVATRFGITTHSLCDWIKIYGAE